jgi:hypothetical protein
MDIFRGFPEFLDQEVVELLEKARKENKVSWGYLALKVLVENE